MNRTLAEVRILFDYGVFLLGNDVGTEQALQIGGGFQHFSRVSVKLATAFIAEVFIRQDAVPAVAHVHAVKIFIHQTYIMILTLGDAFVVTEIVAFAESHVGVVQVSSELDKFMAGKLDRIDEIGVTPEEAPDLFGNELGAFEDFQDVSRVSDETFGIAVVRWPATTDLQHIVVDHEDVLVLEAFQEPGAALDDVIYPGRFGNDLIVRVGFGVGFGLGGGADDSGRRHERESGAFSGASARGHEDSHSITSIPSSGLSSGSARFVAAAYSCKALRKSSHDSTKDGATEVDL